MLRVMTTSACPMAATAVIAARTATWLGLSELSDCGAEWRTNPPLTTMTPTRLSSRCWATVATIVPLPAPEVGTDATCSATGRSLGDADAGHALALRADVAGRGEHDRFFSGV